MWGAGAPSCAKTNVALGYQNDPHASRGAPPTVPGPARCAPHRVFCGWQPTAPLRRTNLCTVNGKSYEFNEGSKCGVAVPEAACARALLPWRAGHVAGFDAHVLSLFEPWWSPWCGTWQRAGLISVWVIVGPGYRVSTAIGNEKQRRKNLAHVPKNWWSPAWLCHLPCRGSTSWQQAPSAALSPATRKPCPERGAVLSQGLARPPRRRTRAVPPGG